METYSRSDSQEKNESGRRGRGSNDDVTQQFITVYDERVTLTYTIHHFFFKCSHKTASIQKDDRIVFGNICNVLQPPVWTPAVLHAFAKIPKQTPARPYADLDPLSVGHMNPTFEWNCSTE